MKPSQPGNNQGRGFVICEVCDGYIKDMEQLRNHMQWIHKVKIHPKMIHNRPPLNCQKCQYRFFTDQVSDSYVKKLDYLVLVKKQEIRINIPFHQAFILTLYLFFVGTGT